ncbi:MAG: diguanylate cyclase [Lachnospiraceae bacterium]|nr:diguanylate cyclase [Lachnospiraceae bacterium]
MYKSLDMFRFIKRIMEIIILLLVISILVMGIMIKDEWISPRVDYTIDLKDGWTLIHTDGSSEEVSGQFSIGNTNPVTFYHPLPKRLDDGQILRIKCPYYSVDAYVEGEHIYHAGPSKILNTTTTLGNVFALIPLRKDFEGKYIYITVEPRHYHYEVLIKDAAITTMSIYTLQRIKEFIPYAVLCIILIIISFISFMLFAVAKATPDMEGNINNIGFIYLSLFGFCSAAWIISDFHIFGMLTGRMVLSGIINYIAFMLCPFLFSGILLNLFSKNLYYKLMHFISALNLIIQLGLFLTGVIDLPDGLIFSQILTISIIIGMLYFGFMVVRQTAKRNIVLLGIPTICFMFFSLSASVTYLMNGKWMINVAMAMTFYSFMVIIYLVLNLIDFVKSSFEMEQVKKMAYCDGLTGLENRRAYNELIESLDEKFTVENNENEHFCIVMLDVNGLKKTNDIYGHLAGDELITGSAQCIKQAFDGLGRCFRTGGDEFVVVAAMEHKTFLERASELEGKLSSWKGEYINGISISIGKADRIEFPDCTLNQLLEIADKRMYKNKQNYYTSQLQMDDFANENVVNSSKSLRKERYVDKFTLTKYTMPIIRQMAEVIPGGFFIYKEDDKRELIYLNKKVLEIYGCDTVEEFKELTGYTFEGMVYPDDFKEIQDSIDTQIDSKDGDGMDHVVYRIRKKNGEIRWVDDYGHYSHSEDFGDIYYVFINDITESMRRSRR